MLSKTYSEDWKQFCRTDKYKWNFKDGFEKTLKSKSKTSLSALYRMKKKFFERERMGAHFLSL